MVIPRSSKISGPTEAKTRRMIVDMITESLTIVARCCLYSWVSARNNGTVPMTS